MLIYFRTLPVEYLYVCGILPASAARLDYLDQHTTYICMSLHINIYRGDNSRSSSASRRGSVGDTRTNSITGFSSENYDKGDIWKNSVNTQSKSPNGLLTNASRGVATKIDTDNLLPARAEDGSNLSRLMLELAANNTVLVS